MDKPSKAQPAYWTPMEGQYEFEQEIASGTFGRISTALAPDGSRVAVKFFKNFSDSPLYYHLLLREISILRQLPRGNPHTTQLLDIVAPTSFTSDEPKFLFLVFAYEDTDLRELLDATDNVVLLEDHTVILLYKLLCALQYIHSAGLIHRDFKPANILLGRALDVRICDFGLSRSLPEKLGAEKTNDEQFQGPSPPQGLSSSRELNKERRLSKHVITRWYRPPEVILMEKNYGQAIDIWGCGCILQELLVCQDDYIRYKKKAGSRILFRSDSCYPLSPLPSDGEPLVGKDDLLSKIVGVIGDFSPDDEAFVTQEKNLQYLRRHYKGLSRVDFKQEFVYSDAALAGVLQQMLEPNPFKRPSAQELLQNPVFDSVREPHLEEPCPVQIQATVDQVMKYNYRLKQYEAGKDTVYQMRRLLDDEISQFIEQKR